MEYLLVLDTVGVIDFEYSASIAAPPLFIVVEGYVYFGDFGGEAGVIYFVGGGIDGRLAEVVEAMESIAIVAYPEGVYIVHVG